MAILLKMTHMTPVTTSHNSPRYTQLPKCPMYKQTIGLLKYLRLVYYVIVIHYFIVTSRSISKQRRPTVWRYGGTYLQITYQKGLAPGKQSGGGVLYKGMCKCVCVHCIMQTLGETCVAKHNKRIRPCPGARQWQLYGRYSAYQR